MKKLILFSAKTFIICLFLTTLCCLINIYFTAKYNGNYYLFGYVRHETIFNYAVAAFAYFTEFAICIFGSIKIFEKIKSYTVLQPGHFAIIIVFFSMPILITQTLYMIVGQLEFSKRANNQQSTITTQQNPLCTHDGENTKPSASGVPDRYMCKNGLLNGTYQTFYDNGLLDSEYVYKDGYKNGLYKKFNSDGTLLEQMPYFAVKETVGGSTIINEDASSPQGYAQTYLQPKGDEDFLQNGIDKTKMVCNNPIGLNIIYFDSPPSPPKSIARSYTCKNGLVNGVFTSYFFLEDKKVASEISYVNGKRSGDFKLYYGPEAIMVPVSWTGR